MEPKVSVIVPMYNIDVYLRKCLDSLAAQTLDELEVILVNDGSVDYTEDIACEYVHRYPERFFYYKEENSGLSAARNFGFSFARAPYVAFVDSDDYVAENIYQQMYETAIKDDSELVCCGYDRISSPWYDPDEIRTIKKYRFYAMHHSGHSIYECPSLLIEASCYAWNKLYSRRLLEKMSFPVGQKYEDSAVVYNMMEMANKISLVNEAGYYYRVKREGAITTDTKGIMDIFLSMDSFLSYYRRAGKETLFHEELNYLCFRHLLYARKNQLSTAPLSYIFRYTYKAFKYLKENCPDWKNNKYYYHDYTLYSPKYEARNLLYHNACCFSASYVFNGIRRKVCKLAKKIRKASSQAFGKRVGTKKKTAIPLEEHALLDIQRLQREILKVIHSFCRENGLRYYAAEGSLLGAERHQGFVPWDDDMDLVMPREDYEKLIKLWNNRSISGCVLLSKETYKKYYLPFIKIVQNENIKYYTRNRKVPDRFHGLSIDIFPLDTSPEFNTIEELRRLHKIRVLRDLMLYKTKSLSSGKRSFACFLRGAPFRSMFSLQEQLKKTCTKYNNTELTCLANYGSAYSPSKEIFPVEWWGEPVLRRFDDTEVMVPQEPKKILNCIYGAYQELPPEKQRVCKHRYEVIQNDKVQIS